MASAGYGAPYGTPQLSPAAAGGANPFGSSNPFADAPAAPAGGAGGAFVGRRLDNDPLNELTSDLLGALPK